MKQIALSKQVGASEFHIAVVEPCDDTPTGVVRCEVGKQIEFDSEGLEGYLSADWNATLFDLLLLAGAVEFCDREKKRDSRHWIRVFHLSLPVHESAKWNDTTTNQALVKALNLLTGDCWTINFRERRHPEDVLRQGHLPFPAKTTSVIPFSDGLDSLAIAHLLEAQHPQESVRVRLGSKKEPVRRNGATVPFANLPYRVKTHRRSGTEPSGRHRGFKFAVISGIAACLAKCSSIISTESGQGALGPALTVVGQSYPDLRSHPRYFRSMEKFLSRVLETKIEFHFPRIWYTKAETIEAYLALSGSDPQAVHRSRSCWQQQRQVGFDNHFPQCGICAACMLRRMSLHAVGLAEPEGAYLWQDLSAATFEKGCSPQFPKNRVTTSLHEYAIAGTLHLHHMANLLASPLSLPTLRRESGLLAEALGINTGDADTKLRTILTKHGEEWIAFMASLGKASFVLRYTGR